MYLKNIEIIDEYRCLNKGLSISLENITLLVGEQGCGKSSLLKLLQENDSNIINYTPTELLTKSGSIDSFYFDTEHNNPRVAPDWHYENFDGTSNGIGVVGKVASAFKSHGEVLREFTVNLLPKSKKSIILLDEPEASLSIKNQYNLAKSILMAKDNKCQLIIATHCLPLIEVIGRVYDLDKRMWKSSIYFINEQKL